MTIITFTSDFGLRDVYVGVVHGVIAGIAPQARVIDLTHLIPPQDVVAGAVALHAACRYLPEGTIHLAVVDPGVGTARRALLLRTGQGWFVGPDNGLFTLAAPVEAIVGCWELTNPRYWLPSPSATFHGRDIFGPAAAYLARGVPPEELATPASLPRQLPGLQLRDLGAVETSGTVLAIDHFGNMITNLRAPSEWAEAVRAGRVTAWLEAQPLRAVETYGSRAPSPELLLLANSAGLLEIAVARGNAAAVSGLGVGATLRVMVSGSNTG
jgi:S-adenosyl-L-methionine hydrolase (adenosine-forming)